MDCPAAVAAKTAFAAVNIHAVKKKFIDYVVGYLCALGKCLNQCGGISVFAGAPV